MFQSDIVSTAGLHNYLSQHLYREHCYIL